MRCAVFCWQVASLNPAFSQCPYKLNRDKEVLTIGLGVQFLAAGLISQVKPLTAGEAEGLNRNQVTSFDRVATFKDSRLAGQRSDVLSNSSIAAGILAPAVTNYATHGRAEYWKLALLLAEANIVAQGGTQFAKKIFQRPRPYCYNPDVDPGLSLGHQARMSFFSGHSSGSATNLFFAAQIINDCFPESWAKWPAWGVAILVPAWVGLERVGAGRHFPTDVIAGYLWGAASGCLIPRLHRIRKADDKMRTRIPFNLSPYTGVDYNGFRLTLKL